MHKITGAIILTAFTAHPAAAAPARLIPGKTSVADTMQAFGAPSDTTMRPDGALTLVYPGARLRQHGSGRLMELRFGPDFMFRNAVLLVETPRHQASVAFR